MIQITDYACCVGRKPIELMKRLFQFVLFTLVLLAAAQPLLADTACAQPQYECSPVCSMCTDGIAIRNSAMQPILASSQATKQVAFAEAGGSFGWCWLRSDSSKSLVATPQIIVPASNSSFFMPVAQFSTSPAVVLAARLSEGGAADTVPKHILFRVFRI